MSGLRGYFRPGIALGLLAATMLASETRAEVVYDISVLIRDNTTNFNILFSPITDNGSLDTNPSSSGITLTGASTFSTFGIMSTGISITGLNSLITQVGDGTQLTLGGTVQVLSGNTHDLTITIVASHSGFSTPVGSSAVLAQSESGTFSNTPGVGS